MGGPCTGYDAPMSTVSREIKASPDEVWEVLADGWLYPLWVVGATRMRSVDESWPDDGARLHHSVGVWPAVLDDETEVLRAEPPTSLRLRASAWPLGKAEVLITLAAAGAATEVSIEEQASTGPGALTPRVVHDPLVSWRNTESLRRLAFLAEGRAGG